MTQSEPVLELIDVTRRFPGVVALADVSFDVCRGEVHALVGENGAGKSTLINLVSGVLAPDAGIILLHGQPTEFRDPVMARRLGVVTVHQEAELFPTLSTAENLALSCGLPTRAGLVDWRRIRREAEHLAAELGEPIPTGVDAALLSVGQRQMLHVAAAVLHKAAVVVLDEPTSALSAKETAWLFERIAQLKHAGTGIIYVSHRQDEIFALADRVTVLRDGRRVWSGPTAETDPRQLIEQMVGREYALTARRTSPRRELAAPARLKIEQLATSDGVVRGVDLGVAVGEIVGLYGLMGAGRTETARAVFGLQRAASGRVQVDGQMLELGSPREAVRAGIVYLPEDRLRQGVFRGLSVRANAVVSSLARWSHFGLTSSSVERRATTEVVEGLGVRLRSIEQPLGTLSGGNQQKVVLGRWLLARPKVLLLDEPTRGVDVAAKQELHALLRREADAGAAILLISSELPELFAHTDRIVVLRAGRVAGEFDPQTAAPSEVAAAAFPDADVGSPELRSKHIERRPQRSRLLNELGIWAAILMLFIALAATRSSFLSVANLLTVLGNVSVTAILALAAASVIVAGGIDISIGALLALAAAAGGLVLQRDGPPAIVLAAGLATGLAVGLAGGLLNALLSLVGRIHPIIVTLGMTTVYRGLLVTLTGGETIGDLPEEFGRLATSRFLGLSGAIWILIAVIGFVQLAWRHTRAGRHLFAVGSSLGAARLVGISQARAWMFAFGSGGLLVGLAAMLELARNGSMQSGMGTGMELQAIAAAVIGGTAITGGRATVAGVVAGALLLGLVSNALVMWQVSVFHYDIVIGSLLLAAVLGDRAWRVRK